MNLFQIGFAKAASQWPDNTALRVEQKQFTYRELLRLSLSWARPIHANNSSHSPVAIYGGRQWQMYAGILAILAAKSTYVPLSNEQPSARNSDILAQTDCRVLLVAAGEDVSELLKHCRTKLTVIYLGSQVDARLNNASAHTLVSIDDQNQLLPEKQSVNSNQEPADYAYLMFTSGSTGAPKGIAVSHQNIISHLARLDALLQIKPYDRVSQFFSLSFDLSVHDMFSCWAQGAALYVIPKAQTICPAHFIKNNEITVFCAVASILSLLDKFGQLTQHSLPSLRVSCFGGEKLLTEQAQKWQMCATNSRVINLYGPTECTITATYFEFSAKQKLKSASVPIGKALTGLSAILFAQGQQVTEQHTLAELYIAGDQLVDGYWQDDEKTAQSFVLLDNGLRYYCTGDIVYLNEHNDLVFHGRVDHQFSIAGHRVEAGEIESAIVGYHQSITWCAVKAITQPHTQQQQLCAFIETTSSIDEAALKQHCQSSLPRYMIPDEFYYFDSLPRNISGKVDLKALISPHTPIKNTDLEYL
ncbi:MAG: AMP-binding protein [Photobacterium aquimaris]|nr:AMP-binding protein [Photobacterium aquimaris]